MQKKMVNVVAYQFDCLPAHVTVGASGIGASSLRVATMRGVNLMLKDRKLRGKRIGSFKINVEVIR